MYTRESGLCRSNIYSMKLVFFSLTHPPPPSHITLFFCFSSYEERKKPTSETRVRMLLFVYKCIYTQVLHTPSIFDFLFYFFYFLFLGTSTSSITIICHCNVHIAVQPVVETYSLRVTASVKYYLSRTYALGFENVKESWAMSIHICHFKFCIYHYKSNDHIHLTRNKLKSKRIITKHILFKDFYSHILLYFNYKF